MLYENMGFFIDLTSGRLPRTTCPQSWCRQHHVYSVGSENRVHEVERGKW